MEARLHALAGRIPRRWRRRVPARLRQALVDRFGHPAPPFDAATLPPRLNLGSGFDRRDGYVNVDAMAFHQPDLVADVRSLPQLPSGRYEEIVAQDVLEHLKRADTAPALCEWRRLLAPGGRLWLRVPDLPSLLRWLETAEDADRHREVMHFAFGTQAYDGDFHLAGFTDVLLCDELMRAGFERVQLERRDDWLWEGEAFAPDGRARPPVGLAWGPGFYRREVGPDGTGWRWGARTASLMLYAAQPVDVELELQVADGAVTVQGDAGGAELAPGRGRCALTLRRGGNRLAFRGHDLFDAPGDPRELAFRIRESAIRAPAATP